MASIGFMPAMIGRFRPIADIRWPWPVVALALARVAAGGTRRRLMLGRSALRVRLPCGAPARVGPQNSLRALRALRSDSRGQNDNEVRCAHRPVRSAPRRPRNRPRRAAPAATLGLGFRDVGALASLQRGPALHAGVAGGCTGMLEVFAHAAESRAPAPVVAPTSWRAATASARDCKQHGADARRAGPGCGMAPAGFRMTATGRKQTPTLTARNLRCGSTVPPWSN